MAEGNSKGWTFDTFETWVESTNMERAKAVDAALAAAQKMGEMHNDLIRKGERDAANYVTKEQNALQFKGLAVALGAVAALAAVIVAIISIMGQ